MLLLIVWCMLLLIVWCMLLLIVWVLFGYCLGIVWVLFGYCLGIVWVAFGVSTSTGAQLADIHKQACQNWKTSSQDS